jgi:DNA-binding CsgD family transcriptional regulator
VELLRPLADPWTTAVCEQELAWTAVQAEEFDQAATLLEVALPVIREHGGDGSISAAVHTAGALALAQGNLDRAEICFEEALRLAASDIEGRPYNIEGLGIVAARRGNAERALRLIGGAITFRASVAMQAEHWWRRQVDDALATAKRMLPPSKAEAALRAGHRLQPDQAVACALDLEWSGGTVDEGRSLLTAREQQVAALVAQGLTNAQIARRLNMAERTVVSHLEHIRTKLDLPSRAQIAVWATEQSLSAV